MDFFKDRITEKMQYDDDMFADAFSVMGSRILGIKMSKALNDDTSKTRVAIDEVLKAFKITPKTLHFDVTNESDRLDYELRYYGLMKRDVVLEKGWYKNAFGTMLANRKNGEGITALVEGTFGGYCYVDDATGKKIKINKKNEDLFEDEAILIYSQYELSEVDFKKYLKKLFSCLSFGDIFYLILASLFVMLLGLLLPAINNIIYGTVVNIPNISLLIGIFSFLICVSLSQILINLIKSFMLNRITKKMTTMVTMATMMRVLSMPASFFRKHTSGSLASRINAVNLISSLVGDIVLSTVFTSIFALAYLPQIAYYGQELFIPAILVIVLSTAVSIVTSVLQAKLTKKQMEATAAESGIKIDVLNGVNKIKVAGAEKRAFAKWAEAYSKSAACTYNPPTFLKFSTVIATAITLLGTIIIYSIAVQSRISIADYYSFNAAYGMAAGAFTALAGIATKVGQIKPAIDTARPILEGVPESMEGKKVISKVSGRIEISHVSFSYEQGGEKIIDDLSLKIHPGEYVAIVGKTGCGKSTLMRLLLGFETPDRGGIYYDGNEMSQIELRSLRRCIGTVTQNGTLFTADLLSNILISAPYLDEEDAWKAAELAGVADDIRSKPMGMHTMVSEGGGGLSGGQKQRIMIARAIVNNPKIIMLDEATSALDNVTQKIVADSLESLKCTRIVIAHRLSTIKDCDRIIVFDKGKIIEDGKYDELIEKKGFFYELVERQRIES